MTTSLNRVTLIGYVGDNPEIKKLKTTDDELAIFSLATTERWKDKNTREFKYRTYWHKIVVFSNGLVDLIKQHIIKGSKVYVEGKLCNREYEDKDGVMRNTTEVVLAQYNSRIIFLSSKKHSEYSSHDIEDSSSTLDSNESSIAGDIPF